MIVVEHSTARFLADIAMIDAAKEAVAFLASYFGPVSEDDPEGWSDSDAQKVHDLMKAALEKRAEAARLGAADIELTDEDWVEITKNPPRTKASLRVT